MNEKLTLQELQEKYQNHDIKLNHMINTFNNILMAHDDQVQNIDNIEISATRCLYLFFYLKEKGELSWEDLKL
tara:strand:- start:98 stop:316 length:219 start_codon:yes stop_codon:yes gene_type:complete